MSLTNFHAWYSFAVLSMDHIQATVTLSPSLPNVHLSIDKADSLLPWLQRVCRACCSYGKDGKRAKFVD